MLSEIQPGQDCKGQGHYSKVKPRPYYDVAYLHPQTIIKYFLQTLIFGANTISANVSRTVTL